MHIAYAYITRSETSSYEKLINNNNDIIIFIYHISIYLIIQNGILSLPSTLSTQE